MSKKRLIIWLEDKLPHNMRFASLITGEGFELISCENLGRFKQELESRKDRPEEVCGFVLDILLSVPSLRELNLPEVETHRGNDTGYLVLTEYIRNIEGESPLGDAFAHHPAIMLSTLGKDVLRGEYGFYMDEERRSQGQITSWVSKTDENGLYEGSEGKVKEWLRSLPR